MAPIKCSALWSTPSNHKETSKPEDVELIFVRNA